MHRKQRGITFIGWIVLLVPVVLVAYAVIRLVPMYLNYSRVARGLSQVVAEAKDDDSTNANTLRVALEKRLDIESVEFPDVKDFEIRRDGQSWVVNIKYEETAPFISNVKLLVTFDKSARVGSAKALGD